MAAPIPPICGTQAIVEINGVAYPVKQFEIVCNPGKDKSSVRMFLGWQGNALIEEAKDGQCVAQLDLKDVDRGLECARLRGELKVVEERHTNNVLLSQERIRRRRERRLWWGKLFRMIGDW
jgi:hypothetical protein